jgi:hypothetical protein
MSGPCPSDVRGVQQRARTPRQHRERGIEPRADGDRFGGPCRYQAHYHTGVRLETAEGRSYER